MGDQRTHANSLGQSVQDDGRTACSIMQAYGDVGLFMIVNRVATASHQYGLAPCPTARLPVPQSQNNNDDLSCMSALYICRDAVHCVLLFSHSRSTTQLARSSMLGRELFSG